MSRPEKITSKNRLPKPSGAFVVAHQPAKAGHPAKTALHHSAAWQQHKPFLCFRQLDRLQTDALLFRGLRGYLSGAAPLSTNKYDLEYTQFRHCRYDPGRRLINRVRIEQGQTGVIDYYKSKFAAVGRPIHCRPCLPPFISFSVYSYQYRAAKRGHGKDVAAV